MSSAPVGDNSGAQNAGVTPAGQMASGGQGFSQVAAFSIANRIAAQQGKDSNSYQDALKTAWNTRQVASNEQAMAGLQNPALAANAGLRKEEWKTLDQRLHETAQRRLNIVNDLRSRGLTQTTDLGTLVHEWERGSGFDEDAQLDMGAETRGEDEELDYDLQTVKLPIAHKSFHIQHRQLLASRRTGQSVQARGMSSAIRKVTERLERFVAYGWNPTAEGGIPGLMTADNTNAVTTSNWADRTNTDSSAIREDLLAAIEALENSEYGPEGTGFQMYVARDAYQELRARDTGTDQERSLMTRINEEFGDFLNIQRSDFLDDGDAVMFKPVEDVIELIVAADMQNVEWTQAGWNRHFKVLSSVTPVVKADKNGQSGIATFTGLTG